MVTMCGGGGRFKGMATNRIELRDEWASEGVKMADTLTCPACWRTWRKAHLRELTSSPGKGECRHWLWGVGYGISNIPSFLAC